MLISFVIMSYNYGRYLPDCVSSILDQDGDHELEVVLVDDASTDSTREYLASIRDPRVRIIQHATNMGHVQTANDGIAAARGEIIARIDSDDRYKPWFLNETVPIFEQHPDVGCVYGDVARIDRVGAVIEDPWPGIRSHAIHGGRDFKGDEYIPLILENFLPAPTLIARRSAWRDVLPIPQGFAMSDWYVNLRIARTNTLYYRARTLADYRIHGENLHRNYPQDRSFEQTVLTILDQIFAESDHAQEKKRIEGTIYSLAYANLASKYQTWQMLPDARRCLLQAVRHSPKRMLEWDTVRALVRSFGVSRTSLPWAR